MSLKLIKPDGPPIPLDRFEVKDRTVEIAAPAGGALLKSAKADFDSETDDREWPGRAAKTMW